MKLPKIEKGENNWNSPDECEVIIDGQKLSFGFDKSYAYTFLKNPKINNGKLVISNPEQHFKTHLDLIEKETGVDDANELYLIRKYDTIEGRVWFPIYNSDIMIMSLWEEFDKHYAPYIQGYTDSLYYEVCNALGKNLPIAYYTYHNKFFKIPINKDSLSPLDNKWAELAKRKGLIYTDKNGVKREMPMAQYNALRYVDENSNNNMKNRIKLNESSLRNIIRKSIQKILNEEQEYIDFCGIRNVSKDRKIINKVQNMLTRGYSREEIQDLVDARNERQNDINNLLKEDTTPYLAQLEQRVISFIKAGGYPNYNSQGEISRMAKEYFRYLKHYGCENDNLFKELEKFF